MTANESLKKDSAIKHRAHLPWWKRKYLVNQDIQTRYALSAVIIGVFSSIVSASMILWAFWSFNIWQGQRLPTPVQVIIVATLAINAMSIYIATVVSTQKLVGPLVNLLRQFDRLSHADFRALAKFRKKDEIHYVAIKFNEMVIKLDERDEAIFGKLEESLSALEFQDIEKARRTLLELRGMRERERETNTLSA